MKKILDAVSQAVNAVPKPIRDFVEAGAAAMVGGAVDQVLGLNLGIAGPKLVIAAALLGALNAGISFARRKGLQPLATPAQ